MTTSLSAVVNVNRILIFAVGAYVALSNASAATPVQIAQQAYLKASNTGSGDQFAHAVAISGDTVVVGAEWESSNATGVNGEQGNNLASKSGAAYVFVRDGTNWIQQAYLKASNTGIEDRFGYAVAISADTIVVGAVSEDSNATGVNGNQLNNSAINSGAAYVFVRDGTNWSQQAYLKASNTGTDDLFGDKVAISGETIVVSAFWEDSIATGVNGNQFDERAQDSGAAYVFVREGTNWTQQAYLKASNTQAGDAFFFVGISSETIVVGAPFESSNATGVNGDQTNNLASRSGAAYVFVREGTNWTQQAYLKASNTGANDWFFFASISGDTIVVGAPFESSNANGVNGNQTNNLAPKSGAAYVFVRNGTNWSQQAYLKASNTEALDEYGWATAVSGETIVVGAHFEDSNATGVNGDQNSGAAPKSGAAYVYRRDGTNWIQQAYLKASNTGAGDEFGGEPEFADGTSVAVSGDTIVVGASYESSNATGVNGDGANNSAFHSGAAYIFTGVCPSCSDRKPVSFQFNCMSLTLLPVYGLSNLVITARQSPLAGEDFPIGELEFAPPGSERSHQGTFLYSNASTNMQMDFTVDAPGFDSNNNGLPDIGEFAPPAAGPTTGEYRRPDGSKGTFSANWNKPANSSTGICTITFDFGEAFTHELGIIEYTASFPLTLYRPGSSVEYTLNVEMPQSASPRAKLFGGLALKFEQGKVTALAKSLVHSEIQGFGAVATAPFKWGADSPSLLTKNRLYCSMNVIDGTPHEQVGGAIYPDYNSWILMITDPNDTDDDGVPNIVDQPSRTATPPLLDVVDLNSSDFDRIRLLIYGDVGRTYTLEDAVGDTLDWLHPTAVTISSSPHIIDYELEPAQRFWRMRFP